MEKAARLMLLKVKEEKLMRCYKANKKKLLEKVRIFLRKNFRIKNTGFLIYKSENENEKQIEENIIKYYY